MIVTHSESNTVHFSYCIYTLCGELTAGAWFMQFGVDEYKSPTLFKYKNWKS